MVEVLYETKDKRFEIRYYLDRNTQRIVIGQFKRARGKDSWWKYEVVFKPNETLYYYEWYDSDYGRFSNGIPCRVPSTLPDEIIEEIVEKLKKGMTKAFDELERWVCDRRDP
jgi:hypothetical protein